MKNWRKKKHGKRKKHEKYNARFLFPTKKMAYYSPNIGGGARGAVRGGEEKVCEGVGVGGGRGKVKWVG